MHSTTRARRRFIAASLVDAVGDGIYVPLTMLFVHSLTGQSLTAIGTGLTVAGLGALASMPAVGVLIDRHGGRRVYIGALALRAGGFALYPLATGYPAFLGVALMVAVAMWASAPSQQSLIGDLAAGPERERLLAWNRSLRNGGMGFGAVAAAAMLAIDGQTGYLAAAFALAAAFGAAAVLVALVPVPPPDAAARSDAAGGPRDIERHRGFESTDERASRGPREVEGHRGLEPADSRASRGPRRSLGGSRPAPRGGYRLVLADRPYLRITAANFLICFGYVTQAIALPVFLTRDAGIPGPMAGVVFAVNTVLIAALGVPVARRMARARRGRGAALGTVVFAFSFAAFGFVPALGGGTVAVVAVLACAVVYTAAELIHSAPAQSLSIAAAPDEARGRYLSVYQLSWALCRTVAPLVLGLLLDAGTWQLWTVLSVSVLTGGLILLRTERHLPAHVVTVSRPSTERAESCTQPAANRA
ncbi:MFS transporter [Glycomyces sp. NPDC046736]|uniref:MFS transporter n=1 Tax=Glycomyces sp. NPDC046736 TaxID=3155615 RepID=UPI0033C695B3